MTRVPRRTAPRRTAPTGRTPALHGAPVDAAAAARLERWGLAIVAAIGGVLLAIALGPHRIGDYFTETDFYGAYAEGARLIQSGRLDASRYGVVGPVYELTLALAGWVVRDLFRAAELISVVSMTLAAWLWFRLLARLADARLALATLALLAVNGAFLRYGFSATTDALAFALQAAALHVLLTRGGTRAAAAAGALAALAFLTRYTSGVLLVAGLVAILAGGTSHERRRHAALAFAGGWLALVAPWLAVSLAQGVTFASQLQHNIAFDVFARPQGIPWDEYQRTMQSGFHSLGDVIARDPAAVLTREVQNVGSHLMLDVRTLLGVATGLAALAGVLVGARDRALRRLWPVLLAGALQFLALVPAFHSERYSLAMLPAYLALAGAFFASPRFALPAGRVWIKGVLIAIPLATSLLAARTQIVRTLDQLPVQVLEGARVLRAAARPGDKVLARKPHIAFHGGVQPVPFPFVNDLPALAAYARTQHVRWLFYSWPELELRPALGYLLDTSLVVPGLTVRSATAGRPAVLYEIGPAFGTLTPELRDPALLLYHGAIGALQVDSTNVPSWRIRGRVAFRLGRFREARASMMHALTVDPRNVDDLLVYGEACLRLNEPASAAPAFDRAEELMPGNLTARLGRGWARLLMHQPQEAAALWRPAIGATRDSATLQRMLALYQSLGDAEAVAAVRAAMAQPGAAR